MFGLSPDWIYSSAPEVIYGKAGDVAKECESFIFLGEVGQQILSFALNVALARW